MIKSRYFTCGLIIVISGTLFYLLCARLIADIHTHVARARYLSGDMNAARAHLDKALKLSPNDYKTTSFAGNVYLELGEQEVDAERVMKFTEKAAAFYDRSINLNPLEADTVYRRAVAEVRLETLFAHLHPEENNPHRPFDHFKKAARMRPNGIKYKYALVRYLHKKGMRNEMLGFVRDLARIYPDSCDYLKKEVFWSDDVRRSAIDGLLEATAEKNRARKAHFAASSLLAENNDLASAIYNYRKALSYETFKNRSADYLRFGRLCLKNGDIEKAETAFLDAVDMSRNRGKLLKSIYRYYRKDRRPGDFANLYRSADTRFLLPSESKILLVRAFMEIRQFPDAKRVLKEIIDANGDVESYIVKARIHELEKDWDNMELAAQKATVLAPENSGCHYSFSRALLKRDKPERALKEADLAIKYSRKPNPRLFAHRARIKSKNNDYHGADEDWKSAIALRPDNAYFHSGYAETMIKAGDLKAAIRAYRKAVELIPDNERFMKRLEKLEEMTSK